MGHSNEEHEILETLARFSKTLTLGVKRGCNANKGHKFFTDLTSHITLRGVKTNLIAI